MAADISHPPDDEFALLGEAAAELDLRGPLPMVRRVAVPLAGGRSASGLCWGADDPEILFLHGGGQNAHSWDSVVLLLGRPAFALDLPGHGHSDPAPDDEGVLDSCRDAALAAIARCAPSVRLAVGMSLGGLTALAMAEATPAAFSRLVLVDILPERKPAAARRITDFLAEQGPFASFDAMVAHTARFAPGRAPASLRRGVFYNAVQGGDGLWRWRHAGRRGLGSLSAEADAALTERLWGVIARSTMPLMLVRGGDEGSVVGDDHVARLLALRPDAVVARVAGAGHSIQGDRPAELARLIGAFMEESVS